jgi:putative hydrolase of the HAD superfamily
MNLGADLRHVEVWLFDLDNTLYPPETELMVQIEQRMTDFVARETGRSREGALALQMRYLHEHGATLAGLMAKHGVDPEAFLDEVHDVSLDVLAPDDELRDALARLPGRRLVFTNGDAAHAGRVLDRLAITDQFEAIFHIAAADYLPKPHPVTFRRMMDAHAVDPAKTAYFEDSVRNLAPAAELGMTTILVGPHAGVAEAPFVTHRTRRLAPFLASARVQEPAQ